MRTNEYLFDTEHIIRVPKEVCDIRIKFLNWNLTRLLAVHYLGRDAVRINAVIKAISFWENLRGQ